MIIALIVAIVTMSMYFYEGVNVSRKVFASKVHEFRALDITEERENRKRMLESNRSNLNHKTWCHLNYEYLRKDGCDCPAKESWLWHNDALKNVGHWTPDSPTPSLLPILTWPYIGLKHFVASAADYTTNVVRGEVVEVEYDEPEEIESESIYSLSTPRFRDEKWQKIHDEFNALELKAQADMARELLDKPLDECTPEEIKKLFPKSTAPVGQHDDWIGQ